ncbi:MAG: flagellar protein FlaG [Rhodospirillales bacterium]|nr:flagellar protein FlaG [Rhodospirillales bacterium]
MVGINSINISVGVQEITLTKHESREPLSAKIQTKAASGEEAANTRIEPLNTGGETAREVVLEDNVVLRISYDNGSGRFIYSGVDKATGDVVRQYPPEGVLKLLAQRREEAAGLLIDETT